MCVYFDAADPLTAAQHCTPGGRGGRLELKVLDRAIGAPTRKTPLAHNQSVCVFIDDTGSVPEVIFQLQMLFCLAGSGRSTAKRHIVHGREERIGVLYSLSSQ